MMRLIQSFACASVLFCSVGADATRGPLVRAPGQTAAIPSWHVQSTAKVGSDLTSVSQVGADIKSWYFVDRPFCTLMGCLTSGGPNVYNDTELFFSDNLKRPENSGDQFAVPWLYRAEFALEPGPGKRLFIITHGISSRADIYLNGKQVADKSFQVGAYGGRRYDITDVASKENALAICVYPTSPALDLAIGWADWINAPADGGTGVWRPVELKQSGPVMLEPLRVVTALGTSGTPAGSKPATATVTLKVTVRNLEDTAVTITASGIVAPVSGGQPVGSWEKTITLSSLSTTEVVLGGVVESPAVWWPKQWGEQPLYTATITTTTTADGSVSDSAAARFGFRTASAQRNRFNDTTFYVNGQPFQVLGGGYAPDIYLRFDAAKVKRELQYLLDLGLNTIRLEGKNEHPELYDIADRMGVMVMPGWECCSMWEAWSYNPQKDLVAPIWSDDDYIVANASMFHEASMMQTHPSVLTYLVGSDYWPDPKATSLYLGAFKAVDWPNPIIISASGHGYDLESGLGPSGLRMEGPYDWVPPSYWWDRDRSLYGSAAGFGSELSAGGGTPDLPSLEKFLSRSDLDDLWKEPNKSLFHMAAETSSFRNRSLFNQGLWRRYGPPTSLSDYVQKAQMADYEVTRAQFEAYASMWSAATRPATGLIYWMLTGALPSLHWNLWDYYMRPSGNYFGAKKGSRVEHVAYDYVRKTIWLINRSLDRSGNRRVDVQVINAAGKTVHGGSLDVATTPNSSKNISSLESVLAKIEDVVFLKLLLVDGDKILSRNVYWVPKAIDLLDWERSDWRHTPVTEFSDLTALNSLPTASVKMTVNGDMADGAAEVTLENESTAPAFFISLSLVDAGGQEVLPLIWSDNYVTLWPRETLKLTVKTLEGAGTPAAVRIWGKNVAEDKADVPQRSDSGSKLRPGDLWNMSAILVAFATLMMFLFFTSVS